MAKTRVHELAKEFGVESKFVLEKLKEMGEFVKSASSTVDDADLTNSPISLSFSRTNLLSTPNSLASSWTRVLATLERCSFWPEPRGGVTDR